MKQLILALFVFVPCIAMAQPNGQPRNGQRFDPQQFQKMVEESLTKAGGLTLDEARAFFPLYNEMRAKQREMGRKVHELKTSAPHDAAQYASTIMKIKQLQLDMASLEADYYKRMLKVVPSEKLFKMMKAEDDFHRRMVQGRGKGKAEGRSPQEHRGRGQESREK